MFFVSWHGEKPNQYQNPDLIFQQGEGSYMIRQSPHSFVSIRNLTFYRGSRAIFDNISLDIERGKITAIMGPSGTGKTTLLKLIGAQLMPDAGVIIVDGFHTTQCSRSELFQMRKKMGMMFQSGALFTDLTVHENVAFPLKIHTKLSSSLISDIVIMKLNAVGLRGAYNLMPSELSGGMSRRVALARAMALDPQLIMYDEPFVGQDPIAMGVLVKLIKILNSALKTTSIIVSHDLTETASIADYLYLLADGHIIGSGSPAQLMNSSDPLIHQFMKGEPDGPVPFHYPAAPLYEELFGKKHAEK